MGVIENIGQLHAQSGKIVNVKEAPIVDVVGCDTEMGRSPMLILNQFMQTFQLYSAPGEPANLPAATTMASRTSS